MQCIHREMHSLEKGLGEGHIEEGGDRSYRGQGASIEEDIRIEGDSWGQQGTSMQWRWTEKEKEIKCALYVKSGAIWPIIIGKEREERGG